jgi:hypothetical protein
LFLPRPSDAAQSADASALLATLTPPDPRRPCIAAASASAAPYRIPLLIGPRLRSDPVALHPISTPSALHSVAHRIASHRTTSLPSSSLQSLRCAAPSHLACHELCCRFPRAHSSFPQRRYPPAPSTLRLPRRALATAPNRQDRTAAPECACLLPEVCDELPVCPQPLCRVPWALLQHRRFRSHLRSPSALSRPIFGNSPRLLSLRIACSATAIPIHPKVVGTANCPAPASQRRRSLLATTRAAHPNTLRLTYTLRAPGAPYFASAVLHPPLCAGGSTDAQDQSRLVAAS